MKLGLEAISPYQVAALRMLSAGIVLTPFAVDSFKKIPTNKLFLVVFSGLIGSFFPAFLFCIAETKIDSGIAGILNALTPLFTIVVGVMFFQLKTTKQKTIGVLIGFVGLCCLFAAQKNLNFENISYASLVLIATLLYGINVNMVARHLHNIGSLHITALAFVFLIIPSFFILYATGYFNLNFNNPLVIKATWSGVFLGVVGTSISSILFYILIKRAGIIFASMVTYGIPIVAVAWGVYYGETISLLQVGSLLIILTGVYIVNKPRH